MDYEKVRDMASHNQLMKIEKTKGSPPCEYWIRLNIRGIIGLDTIRKKPIYGHSHILHILLSPDYPRKAPVFHMETSIWHPNIGYPGLNKSGGFICIGDNGYAPSLGLDDLIKRIITIIRYENIGYQSPYNLEARNWALLHQHLFPLE
jgi:ubiquitin-protein ligase